MAGELQHDEAEARALFGPLPDREPRAGFAATVALAARDRQGAPLLAWLRWSLGGLSLAGAAAVAVVLAQPVVRGPVSGADALVVAQRLDLYEDLPVLQNQEALEDLDVVEALHLLSPEARP